MSYINTSLLNNANDRSSRTLKYLEREQERLEHVTQQISSGQMHQSYGEMPLILAARLSEIEQQYRIAVRDLELLKNTEQNLNYIQNIYERIFIIAKESQRIAVSIDSNHLYTQRIDPLLAYEIDGNLQQLTQSLNSSVAEVYLFAGSRGDNPAVVPLTSLLPLKYDATVSSDYYLGDNYQNFIRINAEKVVYIINADHKSIKSILSSFLTLKNLHDPYFLADASDEEVINSIINKAKQAKEEFYQVFIDFLIQKKVLDTMVARKEQEVSYLLSICNNLNNSDGLKQLELSAKLAQSKNKADQIIAAHKVGLQISSHVVNSL